MLVKSGMVRNGHIYDSFGSLQNIDLPNKAVRVIRLDHLGSDRRDAVNCEPIRVIFTRTSVGSEPDLWGK
jgi:hypothetical protein